MEKPYLSVPILTMAFMTITMLIMFSIAWNFQDSVNESVGRCVAAQDRVGDIGKIVRHELGDLNHHVRSDTDETLIYLKILVIQRDIKMGLARDIASAVHKHAGDMSKDPDLILAIIKGESNFKPNAVSSVGAMGLMQVFPSWEKTACAGLDLKDISDNILCGIRIYSFYEEQYTERGIALTVYNRGPNPVDHALAAGKDPSNGYSSKILGIYDRLREIDRPLEVVAAN